MRTWWISISSRKLGFLGVVILDSISKEQFSNDLLKVGDIRDAISKGYTEWQIHEINPKGQDARSFPKGRIISRWELSGKGYRSTREQPCNHVSRN